MTEWSLKLYMLLLLRFFFKIQNVTFALLHTFSRTMEFAPLSIDQDYRSPLIQSLQYSTVLTMMYRPVNSVEPQYAVSRLCALESNVTFVVLPERCVRPGEPLRGTVFTCIHR